MNAPMDDTSVAPDKDAGKAIPPAPKPLCANCGAELSGPYCHACGQPVKGAIRPLSSMLHDIADTILNIDSRIFHTMIPLYFRPGYLSNEYFLGRRVRFVTPFRLYFFLSVAAFLVMQMSFDSLDLPKGVVQIDASNRITAATTVQEVQEKRDAALSELEKAKSVSPAEAAKGIDKGADAIRKQADKRIDYLKRVDEAKAKGEIPPPDPEREDNDFDFGAWDVKQHPIQIGWLPNFANDRLTSAVGHMKENLPRIRKDPKPFLIGAFGMLPQVLFVLMPLFALLLKIFYIFKRRLYMEHLIVALHSHAFIFVSLLLLTLTGLAHNWAHSSATWLDVPLDWLIFLMGWWLPIYLFVMQKKVYRQGWFFTTLKFGAIGICYTVMIFFGIVSALLLSLATI